MEFWNNYSEKFLALSQREKLLISVGGAVGIFFLLLTFLIDPSVASIDSVKQRIRTDSSQVTLLEAEIKGLKNQLKKDPDRDVDAELKKLTEQSQAVSEDLAELVGSLLSPSQMSQLLETVLDNSKALKLVALESLPAQSVLPEADVDTPNYYIHPVRIELSGKYFDIKDYLQTLENMPVKYFWKSFNYQVEDYPKANLILEVYTLGTRQEFIGG